MLAFIYVYDLKQTSYLIAIVKLILRFFEINAFIGLFVSMQYALVAIKVISAWQSPLDVNYIAKVNTLIGSKLLIGEWHFCNRLTVLRSQVREHLYCLLLECLVLAVDLVALLVERQSFALTPSSCWLGYSVW